MIISNIMISMFHIFFYETSVSFSLQSSAEFVKQKKGAPQPADAMEKRLRSQEPSWIMTFVRHDAACHHRSGDWIDGRLSSHLLLKENGAKAGREC